MQAVCATAWRLVYGISYSTWRRILNSSSATHEPLRVNVTERTQDSFAWLNSFSQQNGEISPNTEALNLPSWMNKRQVFNLYKMDCEASNAAAVSKVSANKTFQFYKLLIHIKCHDLQNLLQSTFHAVWRQHFPHVKIPKEPRQGKCDVCTSLKQQIQAPGSPSKTKQELQQFLEAHRQEVVKERNLYWVRRDLAIGQPSLFVSLIMDGMEPLQERSREHPFWLAKVQEWDVHSGEALLHWFGQHNEADDWVTARWGKAMHVLTEELYEALEDNEKEKGVNKMNNIGKAVIDSIEKAILDPGVVFMFGFKLTAAHRLSAPTVARIRQRIRQEGVLFASS